MYGKKTPKREKKDGEKISDHGSDLGNYETGFTCLAIDPGIKNYAIRVEKREHNPLKITTLLYEKIDFEREKLSSTLRELTEYLQSIYEILEECDVFLVERQDVQNYKSTRIMQHTLTYLSMNFPHMVIQEFDSRFKTRKLGAPTGLGRKAVKEWTINK